MPNREGRGDARLDNTRPYQGTYSVRLAPNRNNTEEGFGIFTELNSDALSGKEIRISGRAMVSGLGDSGAGLLLKTDRDDWLIFSQAVENKFVEFRKVLRMSSNIHRAYLFIIIGGKTGTVWVDDLSVVTNAAADRVSAQAQPLTPTNDGYATKINTPGWQDSAFITADGRELYFAYVPYTSRDLRSILLRKITSAAVKVKGPIRKGSFSDLEFETFRSARNADGTWAPPVRVYVQGVNSFFAAKLSTDGRQMYYVIRDRPGGYGSGDIFVSERTGDDTWGPPQNLGQNINTDANEETPCISADGNTLYFARNRGDALGFELLFSRRVNGEFTRAEKMHYPINEKDPSRTANHQPFLIADGQQLYFTRIQQLYTSRRNSDGAWTTPVKVFPNLPVSGHASVTADGRYLFFLTVKDQQSLDRENWSIWYSEKTKDGTWGNPKPVD
jgi:hypothetical protein